MMADAKYNPKALISNLTNPYTGENVKLRVWEHDGSCNDYDNAEAAKGDSHADARTLKVKEKADFTVLANVKFNRTGIRVGDNEGEAYSFTVDMEQKWYDAGIPCGPEGGDRNNKLINSLQRQFIRVLEGSRRHPEADWFEVIGTVGRNDRFCFKILDHANGNPLYRPDSKGELFTFANDLHKKYGNNRGSIKVTVERVE